MPVTAQLVLTRNTVHRTLLRVQLKTAESEPKVFPETATARETVRIVKRPCPEEVLWQHPC